MLRQMQIDRSTEGKNGFKGALLLESKKNGEKKGGILMV